MCLERGQSRRQGKRAGHSQAILDIFTSAGCRKRACAFDQRRIAQGRAPEAPVPGRCGVPHPAAPGDRLGPLWARFAAVLRPRSGRVCMHVVAHVPLRVYHRRFTVCPHMCRMKISLFDLPASTRRTHALPTIQSPPDRQPGQLLAIVSDSSSQISKIAIKSAKSNHEACSTS